MFYNVENLFDTVDDSTKNDNEFLPSSKKHWTKERFDTKINNLYKTIVAIGQDQPPDIIGFSEVENDYCLKALTLYSPLSAFAYRFIHFDSPDIRGIDVAMLYNPKTVKVLQTHAIRVHLLITRDILYVKAILLPFDTVFVYINHWPSRLGGVEESEKKRVIAATMLKNSIDSVNHTDKNATIIIIGDFNESNNERALHETLQARNCNEQTSSLCNLSYSFTYPGTYKYKGDWETIDHIIISQPFMKKFLVIHTTICSLPFLLKDDVRYTGQIPFRTYSGQKYLGGFSDHLPILLTFEHK